MGIQPLLQVICDKCKGLLCNMFLPRIQSRDGALQDNGIVVSGYSILSAHS